MIFTPIFIFAALSILTACSREIAPSSRESQDNSETLQYYASYTSLKQSSNNVIQLPDESETIYFILIMTISIAVLTLLKKVSQITGPLTILPLKKFLSSGEDNFRTGKYLQKPGQTAKGCSLSGKSVILKRFKGFVSDLKTPPPVPAPYSKEKIMQPGMNTKNGQKNQTKYKRSGLTEEDAKRYLNQIINHMEKNKPFTSPNYTIINLSLQLGIPRHYISQIINSKLKKNFYTFVNEYRIKEVLFMMDKDIERKYTILDLAFRAGFNSKSTFNNFFKKIMNATPSSYLKSKTGKFS